MMKNTMIYLIGFPGIGKLSIAKEICRQADVKLVDNHLINNPVFSIIERDGVTSLPDEVWRKAHQIREVVFETMVELSPVDYNFVLTNVLTDGDWVDCAIYDFVEETADKRSAAFVPVRLHIELEENMRRIASPERKEHLKEMSVQAARENRAQKTIISIAHDNLLDLDVTDLSARDAAQKILAHAQSL